MRGLLDGRAVATAVAAVPATAFVTAGTGWAAASTAYQRMDVTAQMLRYATLAQQLAQGRYDLGLVSVVELTQAQLSVTEANLQNLNARYDYEGQYALLQYTLGALR